MMDRSWVLNRMFKPTYSYVQYAEDYDMQYVYNNFKYVWKWHE